MILIIFGIWLLLVYPFLLRLWATVSMFIIVTIILVSYFILHDDDVFFSFLIYGAILISIGFVFRYFRLRWKEMEENKKLMDQYNEKSENE